MTEVIESDAASEAADSAELRAGMVEELKKNGEIRSAAVEAAMRKVRRELFAPEAALTEVYAPYSAVITKRDDDGNAVSSVSAPQVQAAMLEDAGIKPGMRVAEFGSGGANAAMLAELVGPDGLVVTADVDPEITDRAARFLPQAGYPQVKVVTIDAEAGLTELGPFDVIMVTFGAWDVPPAWRNQLVEGGRLVVPLRLLGLGRTITFVKHCDTLLSSSVRHFGFVPAQGTGAHRGMRLQLRGGQITFGLDDEFPVDTEALGHALTMGRSEVWSGARIGRTEPLATVQMRLATAFHGFCWISITDEVGREVIDLRGKKSAVAAIETDGSFAYVLTRATDEDSEVEFGVHAYGPSAESLAERVAEELRIWSREYRGGSGPVFQIEPAGTPDEQLPAGRVIDKTHSRITISWP